MARVGGWGHGRRSIELGLTQLLDFASQGCHLRDVRRRQDRVHVHLVLAELGRLVSRWPHPCRAAQPVGHPGEQQDHGAAPSLRARARLLPKAGQLVAGWAASAPRLTLTASKLSPT
eukprot:3842864-Lingulodinium_polyedra.AAC.1